MLKAEIKGQKSIERTTQFIDSAQDCSKVSKQSCPSKYVHSFIASMEKAKII